MFVRSEATILHADLDAFFAAVEQRDNPELRGRPVLVGGGVTDTGAYFGKVVSKVPVHRLTDVLDRLVGLYRERREAGESLGAFFRRLPPAVATDALRDLAELRAEETVADDFIDLGESQTFTPEVMDGECAS